MKTAAAPKTCSAELAIFSRGQRSGVAPCQVTGPHKMHEARFTMTTGDDRVVPFQAGDVYDADARLVDKPARAPDLRLIPLALLHESPTNARRTWGDMAGLTVSVAKLGILQPLLARPMHGAPDTEEGYELVFGHRRYRAAKAAKLEVAPVTVRVLSDLEAAEAQVVENGAREDLHPLEEAEGYELLHATHHLDVETIAAKVGKSKAYVYARMKLLALVPEARKAFYDGKLTASVALLVARVPPAMQVDALEQLDKRAQAWPHEGKPIPFTDAASLLEERYTLDLSRAPFDRKDLTLVPGAGGCAECPKKAGNQRGLFDALPDAEPLDADVCTDPTCFAAKREAHAARIAAKLEGKGIEVLKPKRDRFGSVRAPRGYVTLNEYTHGKKVEDLVEKARAKAPKTDALKALAKKTMMVGEAGKPVEIVRVEDLRAACNLKDAPERERPDWEAQRKKRELEDKVMRAAEARLAALIVEKVETESRPSKGAPTLSLLRFLAAKALAFAPETSAIADRRGWKGSKGARSWEQSYDAHVAKLDGAELLGLLVESLLQNDGGDFARDNASTAKHFKIDLGAIEKAAREEVTKEVPPEPEVAAKKKGARKAVKA